MGLIGRRYTAAMPSRPVLIGRGLVPHPHTTTTQNRPTPDNGERTTTGCSQDRCLASTTQNQTTSLDKTVWPTTKQEPATPGLVAIQGPETNRCAHKSYG